jgi:hypothetical protein
MNVRVIAGGIYIDGEPWSRAEAWAAFELERLRHAVAIEHEEVEARELAFARAQKLRDAARESFRWARAAL